MENVEELREGCEQLHDNASSLFEEMFEANGRKIVENDEAAAILDTYERKFLSILLDLRRLFS
jgi:hypothetical protein|tara:strand:+ start:206 stop:394 length:189 start_codon:yes stop_codon:yes gene_type:complete